MITGFNTDIEVGGRVFHVQTEDRGLDYPVIESLVYVGGEILSSRQTSYAELLESGDSVESEIQQRMKDQHAELIREIQTDTLCEGDLIPFGWNLVSNQSFDQVVLNFLNEQIALEALCLDWIAPEKLRAGEQPTIKLALWEKNSERPVVGGSVVVKLVGRNQTTELFSGCTDEFGLLEASCEIPAKTGNKALVLCEAEAAGISAEVRHTVRWAGRASGKRS